MNKKQLKIVTGVAIAVLIVSIIPVFWIGQYLHPFSDDYVFGAETYKIWNATHSISACIQGAWNVAVKTCIIYGRAPIPPASSWLYSREHLAPTGLSLSFLHQVSSCQPIRCYT